MNDRARGGRRGAAVAAARQLLGDGPGEVTMRAVAAELGIQAPSLYKHFPDKRALEAAVIAEGLGEFGTAMSAALASGGEPVRALAGAYRDFGLNNRHLYRLIHDGPLPRDLLPEGLEDAVAAPLLEVFGDRDRTRVAWALAHGLVSLELAERFPPDADLRAAWDVAIVAMGALAERRQPPDTLGRGIG